MIGQPHFDGTLFARFIGFRRRLNVHVDNTLFRRYDDFLGGLEDASIRHGDGFYVEVGHVFANHRNLFNRTLALQINSFRRQIYPVGRPDKQQYRALTAVRINLKLHGVTRSVFGLVRDQFEITESEISSIEAISNDSEDIPSFNSMSVAIVDFVRNTVLTLFFGFDLLACQPLSIRV